MLIFGVVQVPVMLGLALLFALLLDSPLLRGKKFFRLAFFVPYAVPGVIAAIMWGFLYSPNLSPFTVLTGNVDFLSAELVLWAIANVVTWVFVGYNMLIIYSALLAIPTDIYEAARLDGAGQMRIAWSIKIPLVRPSLVLTAILSIIGTLQLLAEPQVFRIVQLGGDEHVHAEHDDLRHLRDPERQPGRGLLGRAGPGHLHPVVHLLAHHPTEGRRMSRVMDADAVALRSIRPVRGHEAARIAGRRGSQESFVSRSVAMLIMVVFTLYFLMPIWWLLVASTKSRGDLFTDRTRCGSPSSTSGTTWSRC